MSQVAAKKRLVLKDERVKVTAHFIEQGSVLQGTCEGEVKWFDVEVSIDTDEPEEDITELFHLAHKMCFTESALTGKTQLRQQHIVNGRPVIFGETKETL